jgi:drug/metabolite transporter (DMT)-like permease
MAADSRPAADPVSILVKRPWLGVAVVLLSATCFATGSALARLAYDHGADPLSVNSTRVLVAALVLAGFLGTRGVPMRLPPRDRVAAGLAGVLTALYAWSLFKAIELIPVPVAILILYTYPLMVGAATWWLGDERPTMRSVGALLLGFAGVGLALDPAGGSIALRGVVHAFLAACGFTVVITLNGRLFRGRDSRPVTLHMLAAATAFYGLVFLTLYDYAAPRDLSGWGLLFASCFAYTVAVITLFTAVSAIGPLRTSLVMNWEPIASIILAAFLLNQLLLPIQFAGAALVLTALLLARPRRR